jgi:cell division septum initiation protein DivIVA
MASESTRPSFPSFRDQAELELLRLILQDDSPYPWNPAEAEAESYFADLEQAAAEWSPAEFASSAQALAAQFDQMWESLPTVSLQTTVAKALQVDLFRQFAAQVPQVLLENIVQRAQQLLHSNLSMADQLVQCVQELLPGWGEDDLQVLARPFAYTMRGRETESLEAALRSVRCAAWTELSGVEQARLSLAIARYAIAQLPYEHPHA